MESVLKYRCIDNVCGFFVGLGSLASPSQLFGQPQVAAPQFFLTGQRSCLVATLVICIASCYIWLFHNPTMHFSCGCEMLISLQCYIDLTMIIDKNQIPVFFSFYIHQVNQKVEPSSSWSVVKGQVFTMPFSFINQLSLQLMTSWRDWSKIVK